MQDKSQLQANTARELLALHDNNFNAAVGTLRKTFKNLETEQVTKQAHVASDAPNVIELTDLSKCYKLGSEHVAALDTVSLSIKEGEFVAFTGPSGSGKSTLLQLIGGLDKPSAGTIMINGQNIAKLSDRKLSTFRNETIGFVFQFFYLQPFLKTSVNIEVPGMFARTPRAKRIAKAKELAEAVGLSDRINHLPKELSGGQMQRAAIARALLNQPKILLADEPTGNLDQTNSQAIIELFQQIREKFGTTIVIVTHDPVIASRADREIRLTDGKVVSP